MLPESIVGLDRYQAVGRVPWGVLSQQAWRILSLIPIREKFKPLMWQRRNDIRHLWGSIIIPATEKQKKKSEPSNKNFFID